MQSEKNLLEEGQGPSWGGRPCSWGGALLMSRFPVLRYTMTIQSQAFSLGLSYNVCQIVIPPDLLLNYTQCCVYNIHSSKKVTQHDFDRLYFYYLGFLFIKLDIPRKLAFPLMPYLLGLFHWGAWRVSKLRAIPKIKTCKINRIVWELRVCTFVAEFTRGYPLPIHCAEVSDSFGVMNGQWVRVHTTQNSA